jgi:Fe-S cluster assembly protein SufD
VRCTHGSSIGQLDEDALFFLRARGIDLASARALLMRGFSAEITARIGIGALRERIDELLLARLSRKQPEAA